MNKLFLAKIYHKRYLPKINSFYYTGFYIKFSLNNIASLDSFFFSINKFNLFSFYERDHGYRDGSSLEVWAQEILSKAGVTNFNGSITLQTFPRVLGFVFNPVSFWFCIEQEKIIAIICEVNNTFGESHNYLIKCDDENTVAKLPKQFHVSPFYDVLGQYQFEFSKINQVNIDYYIDDKLQLTTCLKGEEIPYNDSSLLKLFFRYPFFTFQVVLLIHFQALKLFINKNKYYPKPEKLKQEVTYEHHI
jgi:DUF1365 family protein